METNSAEILAPAGSPDAMMAAIEAGADAVYLGLKSFNARGNAINFSPAELGRYVPLAHARGTKVYVTFNTLVKMSEMEPILSALNDAVDCGVDGVILQDLGLSEIIADHFPSLRRHASTQMAIHNLEGVQFCVDRGFQRVVLARELTLREIAAIRKAFPPDVIELEVFCHGAMCYTYSGMCFFSGSVGGRSGNRGECAYTCRKGYRILNETEFPRAAGAGSFNNYLFSMKDMNTLEVLDQLLATGVDSLKIEGRRKGPAYVGSSVRAYRERMDKVQRPSRERDLQLAFGREYTRAFFERGQYGDAPIDVTATGTRGIFLGELDEDGWFTLQEEGLQRYDGLRLVLPNRDETSISFRDYRVASGDRHRPSKGARIQLSGSYPVGTQVMWVHSQDVDRRYKPENVTQNATETPVSVDMSVSVQGQVLAVGLSCRYGEVSAELPFEISRSGKSIPLKERLFRFGDAAMTASNYTGPETLDGFVPMSHLKTLRRELIADLEAHILQARPHFLSKVAKAVIPALRPSGGSEDQPRFIIRVDDPTLLPGVLTYAEDEGYDVDFAFRPTLSTPVWRESYERLEAFSGKARLVLPMVLRHWDLRVLKARLPKPGSLPIDLVASNPGHLPLVRPYAEEGIRVHADFSLYQLNTWAHQAFLEYGVNGTFTASLEDDRPNLEALLTTVDPSRCEVIAYTDTPLFIAEACSLAALYGGCPGAKVCGHETLFIENDHGDRFEVRHDRCRSVVVGDEALSWSGRLGWFRNRGVSRYRADFTTRKYSMDNVRDIMSLITKDRPVPNTHTENLERVLL